MSYHYFIVGDTGTGKTWFMKRRAAALAKMKQRVLVYSETDAQGWPQSAKVFDDATAFEQALGNPENFSAFVFIDEAADLYEETTIKSHPNIWKITRKGRHWGYRAYIATQTPTLVPPKVRRQCAHRVYFRVPDDVSADLVHKDCGNKMIDNKPLREVVKVLEKLNFVYIEMPNEPALYHL